MTAARDRDPGFEVGMFAKQLDAANRLGPESVQEYGVDAVELNSVKARMALWATQLRAQAAAEEGSGSAAEYPAR